MRQKTQRHLSRGGRATLMLAALLAFGAAIPPQASAIDFSKGDLSGSWDNTISWGASYRLEDPDQRIIGLTNGGSAYSVNGDDGNLNYDKGIFSNTVKLTSELELNYKNMGSFVRFRGFYDYENEDGDRLRRPLTEAALDRVGSRADILDAFAWFKFDVGSRPAEVRLGDQVLSWGESTFIQGGINSINPVDVSAIRVPGAELREALLPEGMVSTSFTTSDNTALELFYLYDWGPVKIDPPGSYFSTNDFAGAGGNTVLLGFGDAADFGPFPSPGDPTRPFLGVPRAADVRADDDGQYGAAFRVFSPALNDTEFGFYYMNYHSRLPTINGRTGTIAGAIGAATIGAAAPTIIGTALTLGIPAAVQAGVAAGVPIEAATAIAGTAAFFGPQAAASTASAFATDAYASTARYFIAFPEDIQLYGISFNTQVGGIAWQGEVSHKIDVPLQADDVELLFSALGPISPALAMFNQVGNYTGQFETDILGIRRLDVTQVQTTLTKVFGPMMGADQGVLLWEGALTQVHSMPSKDELRFEGPGTYTSGNPILGPGSHPGKPIETAEHFADDQSWGYRLAGRLDYNNVIGAFNMSPRFSWQHDVGGVSPGPGGNFIEGRTALTLGLGTTYQNTWQFDVSYTTYGGASRYNLINDRDFAAVNVKYSF